MTFTDDLVYGVLIRGLLVKRSTLAIGSDAAPSLFYKRSKALIFKAELRRQCKISMRRMKIVKVKAEYTIL